MKNKILWITRTAIFIALLVVLQGVTASLGQYVTGSAVNLILIVAVMTSGLASGATVAVISPFFAKLFGIGPAFWQLLPFIALGNLVLVVIWHFIGNNKKIGNKYVSYIVALVTGALVKFGVLYLTIVKLAVPHILSLPAESPPAMAMSLNFSFPQIITASIGGVLAIIILPVLLKAIKAKK